MISYLLIRFFTFPLMFLPYSWIHALGNRLGILTYYLIPKFRKRALSNLSLAHDLHLSEKEIIQTAKESFQNLMITCLEYPKFSGEKNIHRIATCINPETADEWMKKGRGLIFFCGHQANWEILFLEGTSRMPGVAIGRPIKNRFLYRWILSIRQKYGGKIITPKNAAFEGLKALKRGAFLGIVGDQGMPDSGFSSKFLGRLAWTSPLPAILSYRTETPMIVATTKRRAGKYEITYSEPLFPDVAEPMEKEITRLMERALALLEESIKKVPGQWLWQHNRWKQQTLDKIKRAFRQDAIGIILPEDPKILDFILPDLGTFRDIYPTEYIQLMVPKKELGRSILKEAEVISYESIEELFRQDYRLKLLFNFTPYKKLSRHYLHLSTLEAFSLDDLKKQAKMQQVIPFSELLKKVILNA